jgi:hypothetical protein
MNSLIKICLFTGVALLSWASGTASSYQNHGDGEGDWFTSKGMSKEECSALTTVLKQMKTTGFGFNQTHCWDEVKVHSHPAPGAIAIRLLYDVRTFGYNEVNCAETGGHGEDCDSGVNSSGKSTGKYVAWLNIQPKGYFSVVQSPTPLKLQGEITFDSGEICKTALISAQKLNGDKVFKRTFDLGCNGSTLFMNTKNAQGSDFANHIK